MDDESSDGTDKKSDLMEDVLEEDSLHGARCFALSFSSTLSPLFSSIQKPLLPSLLGALLISRLMCWAGSFTTVVTTVTDAPLRQAGSSALVPGRDGAPLP